MLALAREERGTNAAPEPVSLVEVALEPIEESLPLADRRRIDLGLAHAETAVGPGRTRRVAGAGAQPRRQRAALHAGRRTRRRLVRRAEAATRVGAVLEVYDTGPGIPLPERARVFDRFYRLPGTEASGSGIGLALVRSIARHHGGGVKLWARPGQKGLTGARSLFRRLKFG